MGDFFEKLDAKTIIAIIVFVLMGFSLGDKYMSKHLLAEKSKFKNIVLEGTDGSRTPVVSKKNTKHTIFYAFSRECTMCRFQEMMLSLTMKFLDENKWKLMPVAFNFKDRDLVRSYNKKNFKRQTIYFGNDNIKRIYSIERFPSIYFISSSGHVLSRTAFPNTAIGLLWRAFRTGDIDENEKPLLHRF